MTITAELKVYLPDDLDTRFRKAAMSAFGYGRGSLSKAAAEALARWCAEPEGNAKLTESPVPASNSDSTLKDAEQVNGHSSGEANLKGSVLPTT